MGVHHFARAMDDIQSKQIVNQGCRSIADEVKIRQYINNIAHLIKKSITPHLSNDMTYNDIVSR